MAANGEPTFPRGDPATAYDWAKEQLALQHAQIDGLDSKLANAFGFGSALWAVAAAFLALRPTCLPAVTKGSLFASGIAYVFVLLFSLMGYFIRGDWDFGPTFDGIRQKADQLQDAKLTWNVAIELGEAYKNNKGKADRKGAWAAWALGFVAVETVLLTVGLLTSLA